MKSSLPDKKKEEELNNINEIILRMVIVRVLPKKTGIVSCPINLSLCISKISDIAERIKTIPKVKQKATIKPALKGIIFVQGRQNCRYYSPGYGHKYIF